MNRLVETWMTNQFESPYKCAVKIALMSGTESEYNIIGLKSEIKARVDDILHLIHKEFGDKATLLVIANALVQYLPPVSYVEVSMNGEDGITIYNEP
jgi:hypothetical protein